MKIKVLFVMLTGLLLTGGCQTTPKETVVWWVMPQQVNAWLGNKEYKDGEEIQNEIVTAFNEKLEEKKYPYEVVFKYMDTRKMQLNLNDDEVHSYLESIRDKEQIDIFPVFSRNIEDMKKIDDYLNEGTPKKFYDEMPKKFWDSQRINGDLYYIPKICIPGRQYAYYLNKEMVNKYYIDVEVFEKNDWNEITTELKKVRDNSKGSVIPFPYSLIGRYQPYFFNGRYTDLNMSMQGTLQVTKIDNKWKIVNLLETEDYKNFLLWIEDLNQEKLTGSHLDDQEYQKLAVNSFMFLGEYFDTEFIKDDERFKDYIMIPIGDMKANRIGGFAVYKESKKTKEAVELLSLINTDKELSELFIYGVKDKDYKIEDGLAVSLDKNRLMPTNIFDNSMIGNYLLVTPNKNLSSNIKDLVYRKIEQLPMESYLGFYPKVDDKMAEKLNAFYTRGSTVFFNQDEGMLKELDKINKKIKRAGMDSVIEELQNQLDDYTKQK